MIDTLKMMLEDEQRLYQVDQAERNELANRLQEKTNQMVERVGKIRGIAACIEKLETPQEVPSEDEAIPATMEEIPVLSDTDGADSGSE